MGTKTEYYDFNLPADTDYADQNQFNENFEVLDTTLHNMQSQINSIAAGLKYKGAVNYYSQLPSNAEIGDAYTVLYAGSSGTVPDGTEYVWGELNGTAQWIDFSKDTYTKAEVDALLTAKQALLNADNKLNPSFINYDSTHRAVSDTEKTLWNGKQSALDSTQLAAVNSGATTAKIDQIEVNRTELIELVDSGAKNLLKNDGTSGTVATVEYTVNADGTVSTANTSTGFSMFEMLSSPLSFDNDVVLSGCPSGGNYSSGYSLYAANANGDTIAIDTGSGVVIPANTAFRYVRILARNGTNMNGKVFKPMICSKAAWDISQKYAPYAPTNAELYEMIKALQS